jgi:serine phosphatase RsbU (regulator of sigma subunit)/anti-sigma regulatory factor (Ser/Thr protein kinase)
MIAVTSKVSALEDVARQLCDAPGVTAVTFVLGRRTVTYGTPIGPARAEWSVGTGLRVSVWGEESPLMDATMELARIIDLREQEIDELAEALTQANDRQVRLFELSRAHVEALDRETVVSRILAHAISLTESNGAVLVGTDGSQWATYDSNSVELDWLAEKGFSFLRSSPEVVKANRIVYGQSKSKHALVSRIKVEGGDYALAVGRLDGLSFGTAERKIMNALAGSLSSSLQLVVMHEASLSRAIVESEHATAVKLTAAVLPSELPDIDRIDVHALTIPARSVGGDYYTAIEKHGSLRFAVGDVAGKGLPAAVLMTNAITVTNLVFTRNPSNNPSDLLLDMSNGLESLLIGTNRFITMLVGTATVDPACDDGLVVSLANAGHSPVVVSIGGEVVIVPPMTPPVGVMTLAVTEPATFTLKPGDAVIVGSDGLLEQDDNNGVFFGQERLSALLKSNSTAVGLVDEIMHAVGIHAEDQPRSDDQTVFVLRPKSGCALGDHDHLGQPFDYADFNDHETMTYSLELEADLISIRQVGKWVSDSVDALAGETIHDQIAAKIELAIHEICVNIVEHAYEGGGGSIGLTVHRSGDFLHFGILDNGIGFDFGRVTEPDPLNPSVRGYGLMIVRQLTKSVEYSHGADRNEWTLMFGCSGAEETGIDTSSSDRQTAHDSQPETSDRKNAS